MKAMDVHSWSRPDLVRVRHLDLDLDVSFDRKVLDGSVKIHFDRIEGEELILDTRDLAIHSVENAAGFELGGADPVLGAPLRIRLAAGTDTREGALYDRAVRFRAAVARTAADRGKAASVPLHAVAGDPRPQLDSVAGHAGRAGHLHGADRHARRA